MPLFSRKQEVPPSTPAGAEGASYIDDLSRIVSALKIFRDRRTQLTVRFKDASAEARVLDVATDQLLLEDIQPRSLHQAMQAGVAVAIAARLPGLYLYIEDVQILNVEAERGVPFYRLQLPSKALLQQRRKFERYELPLRVRTQGATVTLGPANAPAAGEIVDISAGGLLAHFKAKLVNFAVGDEFVACKITVPNLLDLESEASVRHIKLEGERATVGIELTSMYVTDRRRLEQFVQSIAKISS